MAWPLRRMSGRIPGWILGLAVVTALAPACGLKTSPRPVSEGAPTPGELRLRQYGEEVLVSWSGVPGPRAAPWGGLREHVLWIEELPPGCASCPPREKQELRLSRGDGLLIEEGGSAFYLFRPQRPESGWRARVAYRFGDGLSRPSAGAVMPGLSAIPPPELRWDWTARPRAASKEEIPEARLSWDTRQERIVRVMEPGAAPRERALLFRANLYRRPPTRPWPLLPVNREPLGATVWTERPARALVEAGGGALEYGLRLVDRSGGEGPLSEPVTIVFRAGPP